MALDRANIRKLLELLNAELRQTGIAGELYLVGGAVMCIVFNARESTKDLDAFFEPMEAVREAARRVAIGHDFPEDWLNDAVKGFLSEKGDYKSFLELSNLKVMTASAEYLLAMKCLAMRLGAEFHDEADIRYLIRYLNIDKYQVALDTISRYYPLELIPQKTLYALEEILGGPS
ncbi:MAG: hypothetical protein CMQ20_02510 [Gammaproteobacteria bacterium]|jgi:hypothetical protein|nr:hypothetical protein [Gammaproteobacteria bacterium]|tara:strand:+ start:1029 stop:1553 length:525 start_codon:yes stop_codon:yes gene_type:complete